MPGLTKSVCCLDGERARKRNLTSTKAPADNVDSQEPYVLLRSNHTTKVLHAALWVDNYDALKVEAVLLKEFYVKRELNSNFLALKFTTRIFNTTSKEHAA